MFSAATGVAMLLCMIFFGFFNIVPKTDPAQRPHPRRARRSPAGPPGTVRASCHPSRRQPDKLGRCEVPEVTVGSPAYLGLGRSWLEEVGGGTDTTTRMGLYIGHLWRGALQGLFLPVCWELGAGCAYCPVPGPVLGCSAPPGAGDVHRYCAGPRRQTRMQGYNCYYY